jgi:hypothetical protein
MSTPGAAALDRLNSAFNALRTDICGRGMVQSHAALCVDVERAWSTWRAFYQSPASMAAPMTGWRKHYPVYRNLRAQAVAARLQVTAPRSLASPSEVVARGFAIAAHAGARLGQEAIAFAVVVVVAVTLIRMGKR